MNGGIVGGLARTAARGWTKCPECGALIYNKRLERNLRVCPECSHHLVLSARARLGYLLDDHSFVERDATLSSADPLGFVDTKPYPARLAENHLKTGAREAAIWGTGTIRGYPVVMCALDFTFLGGSMGSVVGEKVTRAIELGARTLTPVLICSASGGARMQEGTLSLMQMAKTTAALGELASRGVPFFSLLTDPTYGGVSASFAMLGDVIVAEPRARAGFAGPQVIQQTIRQKLPEGFQTAEFLLDKGQIDLIATRAELPGVFGKLLAYHHRSRAWAAGPGDRRVSSGSALPTRAEVHQSRRSAWDVVCLARHPDRPRLLELLELVLDDFTELHGDRAGHDDPAMVGGLGLLAGRTVMVIGHQKGDSIHERIRRNFGMPHPEGYRKALRLMQYAERFRLPLLTFIDTPGAYPGVAAEERNQSEAIARNLLVMSRLSVPIVCTVTGEGGSGGALAIGVGNRLLMLENATYSVISPEGCAAILFKDAARAPQAAEISRLSAAELVDLGIVDEVVPEPVDGAHAQPAGAAIVLRAALTRHLDALATLSGDELVEQRYRRFRRFGAFMEQPEQFGRQAGVWSESRARSSRRPAQPA